MVSLLQKAPPAVQVAGAWVRLPRVRLIGQIALLALCLVPIGRQAATDWEGVGAFAQKVQAPALFASVLALVVSSTFLPAAMSVFTRGGSKRISYRDSALAYFGSQPMKYLPGSFWILPGRILLLRRLGRDAGASSAGLLFEMITQALSGSLVAVALVTLTGVMPAWCTDAAWLVFGGSLVASLLLLVAPNVVLRLLKRPSSVRQTIARLAETPLAARLSNLIVATALYAAMWLILGVSFYALLVAGEPRFDATLFQVAIGVSTLSSLAGFLTPFSAGGIGVREGAIVLLLSPFVTAPQAVMVALLARVLALAVELSFFALASSRLRAPCNPGEIEVRA